MDKIIFTSFVALMVGLIVGLFYCIHQEAIEWEQFKQNHGCKVVAKISGSTGFGTGMTSNGKFGTVTTYTAEKTGWACDDGITYYR